MVVSKASYAAYKIADNNTKKKVRLRIDKYLHSEDITLSLLAEQLTELLNVHFDRKNASSLLKELKYPAKDASLTHAQRSLSTKKTFELKRNAYARKALEKYMKNNGNKILFKKELRSEPYAFFNQTYDLSQYEVDAIAELLGTRKSKNNYTYKDLYSDLLDNGINEEIISNLYLKQLLPLSKIVDLFEKIVGTKVGEKRVSNLLKSLNLKRTQEQIKTIQGAKSIREKEANISRLKDAGYSLEELAKWYTSDETLTLDDMAETINKETNNPDMVTAHWLGKHVIPLVPENRLTRVSRKELNFRKFLVSRYKNYKIETSRRDIIAPLELDIYFPVQKIAIEFNGDYWHSDKFIMNTHNMSAKDYHLEKFNKCADKGIKLAFVWETDWDKNKDSIIEELDTFIKTHELSNQLRRLN